MARHPILRTALTAVAALAALTMTGCSSSKNSGTGNAIGVPASSAAASAVSSARASLSTRASAAASSHQTSASASASASASGAAACRTDQLKASAQLQQQGSPLTLLTLTNTSTTTCTLFGWPGLGYTDASGALHDPGSVRVSVPGKGVLITVGEGQSAFAGMTFTTGASCPTLNELAVTPPGQRTQLTTPFTDVNGQTVTQLLHVCGKFTIGTLQPASQGALVGL